MKREGTGQQMNEIEADDVGEEEAVQARKYTRTHNEQKCNFPSNTHIHIPKCHLLHECQNKSM